MCPTYNAQRSSKVHFNVFHFSYKHFVFQYASIVALKLLSQCSLFDVTEEAGTITIPARIICDLLKCLEMNELEIDKLQSFEWI